VPVTLSDEEIQALVDEPKVLSQNYQEHTSLKPKRGHKEAEFDVQGENGSKFRIILRQSASDPFDFSVILGYLVPKTNVLLRLRRYNGKSHEHTNKIEIEKFYGFHIHQATERYQQSGLCEDGYATPTGRYGDLHGALQCMLHDCKFAVPHNLLFARSKPLANTLKLR
jgi:hypothetical protein